VSQNRLCTSLRSNDLFPLFDSSLNLTMTTRTTTAGNGTAGNGNADNDPPPISQASMKAFREAEDDLKQFKNEQSVNLSDTQKSLWEESKTIAMEFADKNKAFDSGDIVEVLDKEIDDRFKGKMNSAEKQSLKREFKALKFGQVYSLKKMKYDTGVSDRTMKLYEAQRLALNEEIENLRKEKFTLKQHNQSLSTSCHQVAVRNKEKEEDLKVQVLVQCAMVFLLAKKIAMSLYNNYGLAISKCHFTKKTKEIRHAGDFGPNSKKAGVPFFKAFFKELSKSPADTKIEGMEQVKNHHIVYNDLIDKTVLADKENNLTGHFLDTKENRNIIWYGLTESANKGICLV
jgi:hypothetical protein